MFMAAASLVSGGFFEKIEKGGGVVGFEPMSGAIRPSMRAARDSPRPAERMKHRKASFLIGGDLVAFEEFEAAVVERDGQR